MATDKRIWIGILAAALGWGCGARSHKPVAPAPAAPAFRYLGTNAQKYPECLRLRDGMRMVYLPKGPYRRRPYEGKTAALPPKLVDVEGYLIDKYEVTNGQFAEFLNRTGTGETADVSGRSVRVLMECPWGLRKSGTRWEPQPGYDRHPVVGVTGWGAQFYARWAGADLPTPDQWMKAAGGAEGLLYPFKTDVSSEEYPCNWYGARLYETAPVGSFPDCVSPVGCYDMAGNVYERVRVLERDNLPVMIKGGAWVTAHPLNLRVLDLCMQPMDAADRSVGFRCVVAADALPVPPDPPGLRAEAPEAEKGSPKNPLPPPVGLILPHTLDEGIEEARERNCPVLLSLHHDTCGQCDRTRSEVFADPAFQKFANERCVTIVGQDAWDAGDHPHAMRRDGVCTLWPGLTCEEHALIFEAGIEIVRSFKTSPGTFLISPHPRPGAKREDWILIPEEQMPKSGYGIDVFLQKIKEAQEKLGPTLTRSEYKALKKALGASESGQEGSAEALRPLVENRDNRIPIVREARRKLQ